MSVRQTGIPLGGFLAALVLPPIALSWGWRAALGLAGAGTILIGLVCLILYPSAQTGRALDAVSRAPVRARSLLGRDVAVLGGAGMFLAAGQFCLVTFLISYLIRDQQESIGTAAILLAVAQLTGAGGRIMWGAVSDRLLRGRRSRVITTAAFTATTGSLLLAFLPPHAAFPVIVVSVVIFAVGALGWNGVLVSLLSELAAPGTEGRTIALGLMLVQPGIVLGPLLFGMVLDRTGSFPLAWLLLAAGLGLATLITSRARDAPPPTSGC